jgi:hypothetical protein
MFKGFVKKRDVRRVLRLNAFRPDINPLVFAVKVKSALKK